MNASVFDLQTGIDVKHRVKQRKSEAEHGEVFLKLLSRSQTLPCLRKSTIIPQPTARKFYYMCQLQHIFRVDNIFQMW